MEENVFRQLEEKVAKIEEKYKSLEDYVKSTTKIDDEHRLRMEEIYSSIFQEMEQVYQELSELELADLLDFEKIVGRFDGEYS